MLPLVLAAVISSAPFVRPQVHPCPLPPTTPTASRGSGPLRKLGDLPDANQVLLVLRTVDGCAYRQVVRFRVSTPGSPVGPGVLVPDGARVQPASPGR